MSLFVTRHQHSAERCPAADPAMGSMLLQHVSQTNAATYGITIQGEAVINDAHTFYMILESPDRERVDRFMAPFAQAGSVEVFPASTCEAVVGRQGCAAVA